MTGGQLEKAAARAGVRASPQISLVCFNAPLQPCRAVTARGGAVPWFWFNLKAQSSSSQEELDACHPIPGARAEMNARHLSFQ